MDDFQGHAWACEEMRRVVGTGPVLMTSRARLIFCGQALPLDGCMGDLSEALSGSEQSVLDLTFPTCHTGLCGKEWTDWTTDNLATRGKGLLLPQLP